MAARRTFLRRSLIAVGIGLGTLVLAAGGGVLWLQGETGRQWLATTIASAASTPGELELTIGSLEGPLPHRLRVSDVVVADGAGTWLRVDQAVIEWRPLALLSRRLVVQRVHVATLDLTRLPETPADEAETTEPLSIPTLPIGLRLDALKIDRVDLGDAVLGVPAALQVSAAARGDADDALRAELAVTRLDGPAGRIAGTAAFDPRTEELSLDVSVQEPAGGLIARLLDIEGLPPLDLTAVGSGRLNDWNGVISSTIGDLATIDAKVGITGDHARHVAVVGTAALATDSDDLPWPLLRGDIMFDLRPIWDGARTISVEQAQITSEAVALAVTGQIDLARETLDATARITARQTAPINQAIQPARLSGLEMTLHVEGALLQPTATLTVDAQGLQAPGVAAAAAVLTASLEPDGDGSDLPEAGSFVLDLSLSGLDVEPATVTAPILGTTPTLHAEGRLDLSTFGIDLTAFRVAGAAAQVEGHGTVSPESGAAALSVDGGLDDLAVLEPLLGTALDGRVTVQGDIDVQDFGERITARLDGAVPGLAVDVLDTGALLGPRPAFGTDLTVDADGRLRFEAIRFEGDAVWLAGDAVIDTADETIEANISLGLDSLAPLGDSLGIPLAGHVVVNAHALGPIDDPRLQGDVMAEEVTADGTEIGDIALTYTAEALATAPRGSIDLTLAHPLARIAGTTDFALTEDAVALTAIDLAGPATRARGELRLPLAATAITGRIDATVDSLAPLLDQAGLAGDGTVVATLDLADRNGRQSIAVDAQISGLRYALDGPDDLTAGTIDATLRVGDVAALADGRLDARIADLTLGDITVEMADVRLAGDAEAASYEIEARGQAFGDMRMASAGQVAIDGEALRVRVDRLDGAALGEPLRLETPAVVAVNGSDIRVDDLDLRLGPASIAASAALDAETLRGTVAVADLPLRLLRPFTDDNEVDGTLAASFAIEGPRSAPAGDGRLALADLRVSDVADLPPLTAESTVALRDGRLSMNANVAGFASRPLELAADIPFSLDPDSLAPAIPETAPISGSAAWQGAVVELWAFVPVDGHLVSGDTSIDVDLAGSLADPRLSGAVSLTAGAYENLMTGTLLEDLELAVAFDGAQARIATLSASDGDSGRLSGTGSVRFDPDRDFPFETVVTLQDFTVLRRDDVTAVQDGQVAVAGSLSSAAVSGELTAKTVEVTISSDLPPDVVDLEVIEVNAETIGLAAPEPASDAGSGPEIPLDLALTFPNQVFVRGLGLDSEWAGAMTIKGTAATPLVDGEIAVRKGQLSLLGQTFELSKGTVSFAGDETIDPFLDIEATARKSDLIAIVAVTGPASRPTIALRSIPELPQDEVIARVLFGKSTGQLSSFEALQLAEAASELSSRGSASGGVLGFTRNLLGLDVLRVEAGDDSTGAPTVAAGQYVTDRVYVGVKQGTSPGASSVGVEVELTPNIAVTSDVGQTGESDIGINFQWDY